MDREKDRLWTLAGSDFNPVPAWHVARRSYERQFPEAAGYLSFEATIQRHLQYGGVVLVRPDVMLVARPVWVADVREDPRVADVIEYTAMPGDCWWVWMLARGIGWPGGKKGPTARVFELMPWRLEWIAYLRHGRKLVVRRTEEFRREIGLRE